MCVGWVVVRSVVWRGGVGSRHGDVRGKCIREGSALLDGWVGGMRRMPPADGVATSRGAKCS